MLFDKSSRGNLGKGKLGSRNITTGAPGRERGNGLGGEIGLEEEVGGF